MNEDAILEFLEVDLGVDMADIDSTSLLFSEGVIDSFSLVNLIMMIEKQSGIRVPSGDVNLDNFDSVERILAYVASVRD